MANDARINTTDSAIISSRSVNPQGPNPESRLFSLPIGIRSPIQCPALALGIDVENVLAAPASGVRVVLHGAHPPVRLSRHGINRDLAQELVRGRIRSFQLHALHQRVEVGWVTEAVGFWRNHAAVGEVLVAINRLAQIAKVSPQLELTQP